MKLAEDQKWGEILEFDTRSWTECFDEADLCGGPSPHGNSWWKLFEHCPHLFEIYHVLRKRPRTRSKPLEVGGLFHECRAQYYNTGSRHPDDPDLAIEDAFTILNHCEEHVPHTVADVRRLLDGWIHAHGPGKITDDREETLLVEPLIEVNNGFPYSTRLDRVKRMPSIMEIKTASRYTEMLLQSYSVDPQFLGQIYCWDNSEFYEQYGPLEEFVVDIAIKGKEQKFPRQIVPIFKEAVHDWERAKRETWLQMVRCERNQYWPRNRSNCVRWGRLCEAHQHCENAGIGKDDYFPGFIDKVEGEY